MFCETVQDMAVHVVWADKTCCNERFVTEKLMSLPLIWYKIG